MKRILAAISAALIATAAHAGPLQVEYDKAQAAFDAGRMEEARAGFAVILPRLDANPKAGASAAIVRARLGVAASSVGDHEAGIAYMEAAIRGLPAASDELRAARVDLARARELSLDFDGAARDYRAILASERAGSSEAGAATVGLARTLMFSDPAAATSFADQLLAAAAKTDIAKHPDDNYAQLLALRGRIDLNAGRAAAALPWLKKALSAAGGMGTMVTAADVRIRGDLALASFLTGDMDSTRKYLANTGAGTLNAKGFQLGADMPLPACSPSGVVKRDDMAIIEFSIGDDGRVVRVVPVYATGPAAALEFGRAVRGWSWTPEGAKRLPVFWRHTKRLELRCSTERPNNSRAVDLGPDVQAWYAAHVHEPVPAALSEAAALPMLQAEQQRRVAAFGPASVELLPVLLAIMDSDVAEAAQARKALHDAQSIVSAADAPADLVTYFRLIDASPDRKEWAAWTRTLNKYVASVSALLAKIDEEGHGASRSEAIVLSHLAEGYARTHERAKEAETLRRLVAIPETALPDGDLLRQRALLRLATLEAIAKRPAEAQALVASTGLSPEQCALVANPPELLHLNMSSNLFPREAMTWGFEGYTRVAYDVDSAGVPVAPRVVIASPPFVFNDAAIRGAKTWRYRPAVVSGQAISCTDEKKTIRFKIAY